MASKTVLLGQYMEQNRNRMGTANANKTAHLRVSKAWDIEPDINRAIMYGLSIEYAEFLIWTGAYSYGTMIDMKSNFYRIVSKDKGIITRFYSACKNNAMMADFYYEEIRRFWNGARLLLVA